MTPRNLGKGGRWILLARVGRVDGRDREAFAQKPGAGGLWVGRMEWHSRWPKGTLVM